MTPMNQILLLVICGFLCFTFTDALECRLCMSIAPGQPCRPSATCVANPETHACHVSKTYLDDKLQQKLLGCKRKASVQCTTENRNPRVGIYTVHQCCTDGDFCNQNL